MNKYAKNYKRYLDLLISMPLALCVLPIIGIIWFCIWLTDGNPVIFKQLRPGFLARPFVIYKFRTMKDIRDKNGNLLPDEYRLTTFGKFLRKTSLDELPELWNVIKGDMSLVGPRALLMEYLDRYTPEQARRHEVKPGMTGWAQVNGRNAISWEDKFKFDVWYVDNIGFWLDLKIILFTVIKVLKMEGISARDHVTAPKFGEENA
ncbi:MAG: sugar transferase [Candidatus Saccharicenans sp.]|nr:sugar transferase [Candidatus Saccharicenans sp.]